MLKFTECGWRILCSKELGLIQKDVPLPSASWRESMSYLMGFSLLRAGAGYTKKDKPCDLGWGLSVM